MVERHIVMKAFRLAVCSLILIVGCGETSSVSATCALGPEFESSVVAADAAFDDFSKTSPRQLQSTMSVLLLSLSRMRDVAPEAVATPLEDAERAYLEVSVALQALSWDTAIADADPLVAQALQVLAREDTIEAMRAIREFFTESCKTELKALPARDSAGATTLPTPLGNIDPDSFDENSPDFDTEQSALRAYGSYVAETVGETVTDEQAMCLGNELLAISESAPPLSDAAYDAFVIDAITRCVG